MAIKIVISNKVKFKVKGSVKDEAGTDQPFDFTLVCTRLDAEQVRAKLRDEGDERVMDFLLGVIEDWTGVKDAEDKPLPYSEDSLRALCLIPGLDVLMYRTYLTEIGAKEKN